MNAGSGVRILDTGKWNGGGLLQLRRAGLAMKYLGTLFIHDGCCVCNSMEVLDYRDMGVGWSTVHHVNIGVVSRIELNQNSVDF